MGSRSASGRDDRRRPRRLRRCRRPAESALDSALPRRGSRSFASSDSEGSERASASSRSGGELDSPRRTEGRLRRRDAFRAGGRTSSNSTSRVELRARPRRRGRARELRESASPRSDGFSSSAASTAGGESSRGVSVHFSTRSPRRGRRPRELRESASPRSDGFSSSAPSTAGGESSRGVSVRLSTRSPRRGRRPRERRGPSPLSCSGASESPRGASATGSATSAERAARRPPVLRRVTRLERFRSAGSSSRGAGSPASAGSVVAPESSGGAGRGVAGRALRVERRRGDRSARESAASSVSPTPNGTRVESSLGRSAGSDGWRWGSPAAEGSDAVPVRGAESRPRRAPRGAVSGTSCVSRVISSAKVVHRCSPDSRKGATQDSDGGPSAPDSSATPPIGRWAASGSRPERIRSLYSNPCLDRLLVIAATDIASSGIIELRGYCHRGLGRPPSREICAVAARCSNSPCFVPVSSSELGGSAEDGAGFHPSPFGSRLAARGRVRAARSVRECSEFSSLLVRSGIAAESLGVFDTPARSHAVDAVARTRLSRKTPRRERAPPHRDVRDPGNVTTTPPEPPAHAWRSFARREHWTQSLKRE